MHHETILNVFPGSSDASRLVLVETTTICGLVNIVLRQETLSPDVGWFTQSSVVIEPSQVAALKMTLSPNRYGDSRKNGREALAKRNPEPAPTTLRLHEAI